MLNTKFNSNGTMCQRAKGVTIEGYDLSNCELLPKYKRIKGNRILYEQTKKYNDVKKSVEDFQWAFQPVIVTADGYVLDGQNRLKISRELWDKGTDSVLLVVTLPFTTDTIDTHKALIEIQKTRVWTPEDKINSYVELGNETAKLIRRLADEPMDFFKSGRFGIRNALTIMGLNPETISEANLPAVISKEKQEEAERLFGEVKILLNNGRKEFGRVNNWTETLFKAWRRIRLCKADAGEDDKGAKTIVNPIVLNERLNEIGIEAVSLDWATTARSLNAFSTSKLGRWVYVFETAINDRYYWMQKKKIQ